MKLAEQNEQDKLYKMAIVCNIYDGKKACDDPFFDEAKQHSDKNESQKTKDL